MLRTVVGAAAIQVILLVLLVPHFAATGAAFAYAVSMSGMYLIFTRIAYRELVMLGSSGEE
jgi:O-antigen/teichoic acid export membrane protein